MQESAASPTLPPFGFSIHYVDADLSFKHYDPDNEHCSHWRPLVTCIHAQMRSITYHAEYKPDLDIRWIHLLLIDPEYISNPHFLDAFANSEFRGTVAPADRFTPQVSGRFNPVISISHEDLLEAYTYYGDLGKQAWETHLQYLNPDPRIKFLDSGIWHRYVPELPSEGTFAAVFEETLSDIKSYWDLGLYYTVPAVSSLDLHLRMLCHSYIGTFGEGGHSTVVTPFKFHSERFFKRRLQDESDFFLRPWGDDCLAEILCWRCLAVDDNADEVLSTIDDSRYRDRVKVKKSLLIRRPLDQLYRAIIENRKNADANEKNVKKEAVTLKSLQKQFKIVTPKNKKGVVDQCIGLLHKQSFDILFLDYLLGEQPSSTHREYGHAFLLNLIQRRNDTNIHRDFMGRHWIFPISSFPFALSDKLIQLGIGHSQPVWHLSTGGDPVSSPYLYAFYLLRFMKERVRAYFLYPNMLGRLLDSAPEFKDDLQGKLWALTLADAFRVHTNTIRAMKNGLKNDDDSKFLQSISGFKMLDQVEEIVQTFRNIVDEISNPNNQLHDEGILQMRDQLNKIKKQNKEYELVIDGFIDKLKRYTVDSGQEEAKLRIRNAAVKKDNVLILDDLQINRIPPEILVLQNLRKLSLKNNRLKTVHSFAHLSALPLLDRVDLDGNNSLLELLWEKNIGKHLTWLSRKDLLQLFDIIGKIVI